MTMQARRCLGLLTFGLACLTLSTRPAMGLDFIFADGFETGDTLRWACVNLECFQVACGPGPGTTISGTVYAPNGTLPLPNVTVYIPNAALAPLPAGAQCSQCATPPSGSPLVLTTTAADGTFTLTDAPATANVPVVLLAGKWRREITVPNVPACLDTPLAANVAVLPKNGSQGDMPTIAVSTGGAEALECLLRKIGIDDAEFTPVGQGGHVQLWAGTGGTDAYDPAHGGAAFGVSTALWASVAALSPYDLVLLSCEGSQNSGSKPALALEAMKAYADLGGRVYAGHWHNYWIQAGPTPWNTLATWNFLANLGSTVATVLPSPPRSGVLADWLFDVGATGTLGTMPLQDTRHTVTAVNESLVAKWIHEPTTSNGFPSVQYFSFTTPVEQPLANRCGRVVFSDTHLNSGDTSSSALAFPSGGCTSAVGTMGATEKLLAFMVFDLGTCTGTSFE